MTIDELNERWENAAKRPIAREMAFDGDFLVLGAQTRLAKLGAPVDAAGLEARLAAAHGRAVGTSPLRHVCRSIEKWREADKALALMHLALSGLAKLAHPKEDARRLFVVDALIEAGVAPSVIIEGLGLESPSKDQALDKYNPDQPRVPAGNPDGGRWTDGDWVGAARASTTKKPAGVQIADLSGTRGYDNEVVSDAAPQTDGLPIEDAAYQGRYHDFLRDQFADILRAAGNSAITEVPLTMAADPPITAQIDILFRTAAGIVYGIEVKTGDDPSFTLAQRIVYPHVDAGGIVMSSDLRITALGLTPGLALGHIAIVVMRTAGPGAPIKFLPLSRYLRQ
jgi:hypothetical protein